LKVLPAAGANYVPSYFGVTTSGPLGDPKAAGSTPKAIRSTLVLWTETAYFPLNKSFFCCREVVNLFFVHRDTLKGGPPPLEYKEVRLFDVRSFTSGGRDTG